MFSHLCNVYKVLVYTQAGCGHVCTEAILEEANGTQTTAYDVMVIWMGPIEEPKSTFLKVPVTSYSA